MNLAISPASATRVCVASGDVVSTTIEDLRQRLDAVSSGAAANQPLEIDLRATRLIDSVGLNLLVTVIKREQAGQRPVLIRVGHASVERILQFTRLDRHATIRRD